MKREALIICTALFGVAQASAQPAACPQANAEGHLLFRGDHDAVVAIAMRTKLNINADGTAASYVPGNRGYTYIANGVNLIDHGRKVSCSASANTSRCNRDWRLAEEGQFWTGTPEFCAFAIDVEPITPGAERVNCEDSSSRFIVGNGLGRPKPGTPVPTATEGVITPYLSTTALRHTVGGEAAYIDAGTVPALVVPRSRSDLLGAIAWVRYEGRSTFAIVGDTGPGFGEGSVALHQILQGRTGGLPPVGPIPREQRCSPLELGLRPPFMSRPDGGDDDRCRPGYRVEGNSDIRAYAGIDEGVESVILARVRPPIENGTVTQEITASSLRAIAEANGYSQADLAAMADCLAGR